MFPAVSRQNRFLILTIAMITLATTSLAQDESAETKVQMNRHSHLIYCELVKDEERGSLKPEMVLHSLPFIDDQGVVELNQRRTISPGQNQIYGIHDGMLFAGGARGAIELIQMKDGQRKEIVKYRNVLHLDPQRGVAIVIDPSGIRIQRYDFDGELTGEVKLRDKRPSFFGTVHQRVCVSPDGQQIVAATSAPDAEERLDGTRFQLQVIDFEKKLTRTVPLKESLSGRLAMTGGGDHYVAPPLILLSDQKILTVVPQRAESNAVDGVVQLFSLENQGFTLISIDLKSGEITKIATREASETVFGMTVFEHDFWIRSDGELMLRSRNAGDFRVDFTHRKLVPDRRISKHYELKGDIGKPSLWFGGQRLAEQVLLDDVSISPDGQQVVWLTHVDRRPQNLAWASAEKTMNYHSPATGKHELLTSRFRSLQRGIRADNPITNPPFFWIEEKDLGDSAE